MQLIAITMTKHDQIFMCVLQKLISDERFQSLVEGDVHRQLPVQFVNAVVSTPSMSDEIQVEIMKVCGDINLSLPFQLY
jgi:hypothetical protein